MTKGGFLRMVWLALGAAGFVAVVMTAAAFAFGGAAFAFAANSASAFAAFAAVVAPQLFVMSVWFAKGAGADARRVFMLWAVKFSMIFLLMAVAARGLSALSTLAAPGFVIGVVGGIFANLCMAAKMTMQFASYNKRQV